MSHLPRAYCLLVGIVILSLLCCACGSRQKTEVSVPSASDEPLSPAPGAAEGTSPALQSSPAGDVPAAPAVQSAPLDPALAAVVNGAPITREVYEAQLAQARGQFLASPVSGAQGQQEAPSEETQALLAQLEAQVLQWMIDQLLIEQAAAEQGIAVSDDRVDRRVAAMRGSDASRFDQWLAASGMTLEELEHQVRLDILTAEIRDRITSQLTRRAPHYRVRHILLSEEARAQQVLQELRQGQNFIQAAREHSEDPFTRDAGGDLGFLPRGVMPPAFEEAAYALRPGEISDVVATQAGLHIIQLVEIDPDRPIEDTHWPAVQQRAFEDWLAQRRAQAVIQR